MSHPSRETITLAAYRLLAADEMAAAQAHFEECADCRAEWRASQRECGAIATALEPVATAAPRSWKPVWKGFLLGAAAAAVAAFLMPRGAAFERDRVSADREGFAEKRVVVRKAVLATDPGALFDISGKWITHRRGRAVYLLSPGETIEVGEARVQGEGIVEISIEPSGKDALYARAVVAAVPQWNVAVVVETPGGDVTLGPGDMAASRPDGPPAVLRASEDPHGVLAKLLMRIAELQTLAGTPPEENPVDLVSPEAIGRWLAGRPPGARAGEEIGRLWAREMREADATASEVEAGPAKERLVAGFLRARGLSPEQDKAWRDELEKHTAAWREYLRKRKDLAPLERALAAARVASGREETYDRILMADQRDALRELEPWFREWRTHFAPVFRIVVGKDGLEKAIDSVVAVNGGASDAVRRILAAHSENCLKVHDGWEKRHDIGEQIDLLNLLVGLRDRLIKEGGLAPDRAAALLVDFVRGEGR